MSSSASQSSPVSSSELNGSLSPTVASSPPALSAPSGDALQSALLSQLEFYFSKDNLLRDAFLQSHLSSTGWIPVDVIASFRKVQSLTTDRSLLVAAMRRSRALTLDASNSLVRPAAPLSGQRVTVILRDLDSRLGEGAVLGIFAAAGCPAQPVSVRSEVGDCWFVTFDSEDACVDVATWLTSQSFDGKPIHARVKSVVVPQQQPLSVGAMSAAAAGSGSVTTPLSAPSSQHGQHGQHGQHVLPAQSSAGSAYYPAPQYLHFPQASPYFVPYAYPQQQGPASGLYASSNGHASSHPAYAPPPPAPFAQHSHAPDGRSHGAMNGHAGGGAAGGGYAGKRFAVNGRPPSSAPSHTAPHYTMDGTVHPSSNPPTLSSFAASPTAPPGAVAAGFAHPSVGAKQPTQVRKKKGPPFAAPAPAAEGGDGSAPKVPSSAMAFPSSSSVVIGGDAQPVGVGHKGQTPVSAAGKKRRGKGTAASAEDAAAEALNGHAAVSAAANPAPAIALDTSQFPALSTPISAADSALPSASLPATPLSGAAAIVITASPAVRPSSAAASPASPTSSGAVSTSGPVVAGAVSRPGGGWASIVTASQQQQQQYPHVHVTQSPPPTSKQPHSLAASARPTSAGAAPPMGLEKKPAAEDRPSISSVHPAAHSEHPSPSSRRSTAASDGLTAGSVLPPSTPPASSAMATSSTTSASATSPPAPAVMNYARMVGSMSAADAARLEEQLKAARLKKAQQDAAAALAASTPTKDAGKDRKDSGAEVKGADGADERDARDATRRDAAVDRKDRFDERERQRYAAYQARKQREGSEVDERRMDGGERRERSWRRVEPPSEPQALRLEEVKGAGGEEKEERGGGGVGGQPTGHHIRESSGSSEQSASPLPTAVRTFSYAEMAKRTTSAGGGPQKSSETSSNSTTTTTSTATIPQQIGFGGGGSNRYSL